MSVIRWSFLGVGVVIILLAVLLVIKESTKVESWYTAIAMAMFGGLQIGANFVLARAARGGDRQGFDISPSDRRDHS